MRSNIRSLKIDVSKKLLSLLNIYKCLTNTRKNIFIASGIGVFILTIFINIVILQSITKGRVEVSTNISAIGASSYKNRDFFDIGGQLSDKMIQFSTELLQAESGFIDNYIGALPNPADYEVKNKDGKTIKLETRKLIDIGITIAISILCFTSILEGLLILLSGSEDRLFLSTELFRNTIFGVILVISIPLLIKFSIDFVNALNQTIVNSYLSGFSFGDKSLSESIISSIGINTLDPNPNFIIYVGLSIVLLLNCFIIGVNYFLLIFLSIISPLVFAFFPLHSARKYILDWINKFFQCLIIWPAWIIGIAVLIQIVHASKDVNATTILGLVGLFGLTAIPSIAGGVMGSVSTMLATGAFSFATRQLGQVGHHAPNTSKSEHHKDNEHTQSSHESQIHHAPSNIAETNNHKTHVEEERNSKTNNEYLERERSDLRGELINTFRYPLPTTQPQNIQIPTDKKRKLHFFPLLPKFFERK